MRRTDRKLAVALCFALAAVSVIAATVVALVPAPVLPTTRLATTSGDQRVTLTWEARPDFDGWEYRHSAADGQTGRWVRIPAGFALNSYVVASLPGGQAHRFQVRGVAGARRGPPSNEATATTKADPAGSVHYGDIVGSLRNLDSSVTKLNEHIVGRNTCLFHAKLPLRQAKSWIGGSHEVS